MFYTIYRFYLTDKVIIQFYDVLYRFEDVPTRFYERIDGKFFTKIKVELDIEEYTIMRLALTPDEYMIETIDGEENVFDRMLAHSK